MKNFLLVIYLFSVFVSCKIIAQVDTAWVKRFNGPASSNDMAKVIKVDANGFVYVGGQISVIPDYPDFGIVKYDPDGDTVWVRYFMSPVQHGGQVNDMALDNSGNVIAIGSCTGNTYTADFLTVKYDGSGNELWAKTFDGGDADDAAAVTTDNLRNIYVTGSSEALYQYRNYLTIKYTPYGDTIWVRSFDGFSHDDDYPAGISLDEQGNVYVSGTSKRSFYEDFDYLTIKYDAGGHLLWLKKYNGIANSNDYVRGLVVDDNANVYVAGISFNADNYLDYLIIKYDTDGDSLWERRYNSPINTDDWLTALSLDSSGNVIVTGKSYVTETGYDYLTIKYSPEGTEEWVKNYAGYSDHIDGAAAIVTDKYDNIYITGSSSASSTNIDYATIKYDKYGNQIWEATYNGTGNSSDDAVSIDADNSGNIYITGISIGSGTGADFATIKYVQSSSGSVEEPSILSPEFKLFQNYPNPFNPCTKIRWQSPVGSWQTLKVYDILGREVVTLVDEYKPSGTYWVEFSANHTSTSSENAYDLPSGVYFYQLKTSLFIKIMKMVLIK